MKYLVYSSHHVYEGEEKITVDMLEVTRTDKATALNDVQLIKSVCHRHAWIEEPK